MLHKEYFRNVNSIQVEGKTFAEIDGTPIDNTNVPLRPGHIPELCRFVVEDTGKNKTFPQLRQVSPSQERTFELAGFDLLYSDKYRNLYTTFVEKGVASNILAVHRMDNAPSGFGFWGLLETDSLKRAFVASSYLRAHNIETEYLIKVMHPDHIPFKGKLYTREELKNQILLDAIKNTQRSKYGKRKYMPSGWAIPSLAAELQNIEFITTLRGMPIAERLFDYEDADDEEFKTILDHEFWHSNMKGYLASQHGEAEYKQLDSDNQEDVIDYFTAILPSRIAATYAKLHNLGLIHVHPHLGNILVSGGMCDTDSVKGEPLGLGDAPVTDHDITEDVHRLLYGYWDMHMNRGLLDWIHDLNLKRKVSDTPLVRERFEAFFIDQYIEYRGWDSDLLGNIDKITPLINHTKISPFSYVPELILKRLASSGQWPYNFNFESTERIAAEMFKSQTEYWNKNLPRLVKKNQMQQQLELTLHTVGKPLLRREIYTKFPEAFDKVLASHGDRASSALLDMVTLYCLRELRVDVYGKIYEIEDGSNETRAATYIHSIFESSVEDHI